MNNNLVTGMIENHPHLRGCEQSIGLFCERLAATFKEGGKLIIAGNGGSMADAQHIAGELIKSFERRRVLSPEQRESFRGLENGRLIAENLQNGFPVWVLGLNAALLSATLNDFQVPHMEFAQEVWVAGSSRDLFLGISTSGRAKNVYNAMIVAKAKKIYTVALTGQSTNPLTETADLSIQAPSMQTSQIQEYHQLIYHAVCRQLEADFFPEA
jgi:D-sedoheptulose 7-phosphate isomerase